MLAKYRTKNDGWNISIGWYATLKNTAKSGEFGHARVSVFDIKQISRRFNIAAGLNSVCAISKIARTCSESRGTGNS